jgi:hypothetical protein
MSLSRFPAALPEIVLAFIFAAPKLTSLFADSILIEADVAFDVCNTRGVVFVTVVTVATDKVDIIFYTFYTILTLEPV